MQDVYAAYLYKEDSGGYSVIFPEVEGAITQGETLFEALTNAESALAEIMVAYEDFKAGRGEKMTNRIRQNVLENSLVYEAGIDSGDEGTYIKVDTDEYRKNPSSNVELWYSPKTKKYYTMLADDNAEVKSTIEKMLRKVSGVS